MGRLRWHAAYHADWLEGMKGLSMELRGMYFSLCCLIYDHGGAIPNNPQAIGAELGLGTAKTRNLINELLKRGKMLSTAQGGLHNQRCIIELERSTFYSKNEKKYLKFRSETAGFRQNVVHEKAPTKNSNINTSSNQPPREAPSMPQKPQPSPPGSACLEGADRAQKPPGGKPKTEADEIPVSTALKSIVDRWQKQK